MDGKGAAASPLREKKATITPLQSKRLNMLKKEKSRQPSIGCAPQSQWFNSSKASKIIIKGKLPSVFSSYN
jgi:hypothetical protein